MTYTILAALPHHGLLGAATASKSLAVGNSVLGLVPSIGVVASQAWTNRALRGRLLDGLRRGVDPAQLVERVPEWDTQESLRQVAALSVSGRGAARTGAGTTPWAGHRVLPGLVVAGNVLDGPHVLDDMVAEFGAHPVDDDASFAFALVHALRAGERAGGDRRGRQSAAVMVGTIVPDSLYPPDLTVDLRVDDHTDPLEELERTLRLWRSADVSAQKA